ncbi:basic amino acid ABC transporter substrate-binding protein [Wielerella bovis]|uniref:basic amino acid ABC transporter substrate-binding protein n=1 Tax=Wielerella bovis TaxID=2917790 RepID=UPI002018F821|nr:basic amino acid ABC transporter substrate-binding protein [Wielerella bovis]ULJ68742.1 basic amino acid ABC transporter substrate-binding protein [Wielerella bovis]
MKTSKKWLCTVVSCAALTLAACGGGQSNTTASNPSTEGKTLRVGMNAEFAPFESLNEKKEIHGFDVDVMTAMAKEGGFKVEFTHRPWDSLFAALGNGDVDVLASAVTITDDRKKSMDFSDPYYQITQVILVPPTKNIQSVEDLTKMARVGVVNGNTGDLAAQKIFGATSKNIARFESIPLLMKEVESGGVDAAISDSAVVANYIKNNGDKGFKMVQVPDFTVENYGFALRKGDTATLTMLNDSLKKIRENGEYKKIEDKYFAE